MRNIESVAVASLGALSISVFFSQTAMEVFALASLLFLLIWRFRKGPAPTHRVPRFVIIMAAVFLLNLFINVLVSADKAKGFVYIENYWKFFLSGLLFTAPICNKNRMKIIAAFLIGAFFSGLWGVFQHYGIFFQMETRANGNTHSIYYAGMLAFPCASAIMLLLSRDPFVKSVWGRILASAAMLISLAGILFSQSRGVWIAVFGSWVIMMFFLYGRRKAGGLVLIAVAAIVLMFTFNGALRRRATSIVTSIYTENYTGSTGNRLQLWKGALLMYTEHPVLGTGINGWGPALDRLISEGKVAPVPVRCEAHNMFLQGLATQGTVGFVILLLFIYVLFKWGMVETRDQGGIGGHMIIWSTLLVIIGGLTENSIGLSKYLAVYCLTIGLMGGYRPAGTASREKIDPL
ncbi:MAG: O-antigen ligase family protein [Actinomycetota bacterium]|nr:O-antigen ligase family protein [Nitrospiraceae bacterium]MDA8155958.1 O-antigen ligase family protein [Actinomycetota bacterium]